MSDLSQDELTVLMIAVHGESMMAIGRWQKPIESLLQKGYMQSRGGDNFNCVITPAGRAACEARDRQDTVDLMSAITRVNRRQPEAVTADDVVLAGTEGMPTCPTCNVVVRSQWKYCAYCGGILHA